MKRIIITFVLAALIKGILLFFSMLAGDFFEGIPILLRFLTYLVLIGFLDWRMLNSIKYEITKNLLIKSLVFSYLSFIATLPITGNLFQFYNFITDTVVDKDAQMTVSAFLTYLIFGLLTTLISVITWTRKNKKKAANNVYSP